VEQLIPLIIMLIVGSLFRKKKGADGPAKEQSKPVTVQQGSPNDPVKKLKEMYKQVQQEMQSEPGDLPRQKEPQIELPPQRVEVRPAVIAEPVSRQDSAQSSRGSRTRTRSRDRISSASAEKRLQVQKAKTSDFLPRSEQDLIKGVIFFEIFGPPKSKR